MKIIQEHEKCIGCGSCVAICSKYWEMDGSGKAKLIGSEFNSKSENYELDTEEIGCNQSASDACPVECICIKKS